MKPEVLKAWADQLQTLHPQLPQGLIDQILRNYSKNPKVFNEVCEEFKINPIDFKDRNYQPIYNNVSFIN